MTLAQEQQQRLEQATWYSRFYPVVFVGAFAVEFLVWRNALYPSLALMAVLAFLVLFASVPWIGSVRHNAESAALRSRAARLGFAIPALLGHLAAAAFYGPHWHGGATSAGISLSEVLTALASPSRMAGLCVRAAAHAEPRDLEFLLRLNADPTREDAEGRSPVYEVQRVELLRLLRSRLSRIAPDRAAATLSRFADRGETEAVRILLDMGADPNLAAPDSQGNRPAHLAAFSNHPQTLTALIAAGARLDLRNDRGETVRELAARWHADDALRVIDAAR